MDEFGRIDALINKLTTLQSTVLGICNMGIITSC